MHTAVLHSPHNLKQIVKYAISDHPTFDNDFRQANPTHFLQCSSIAVIHENEPTNDNVKFYIINESEF